MTSLPRSLAAATLLALAPGLAAAQAISPAGVVAVADSGTASPAGQRAQRAFWKRFAAGFATSILLHEAGHVAATWALGGHPGFGFDRGRPTIYNWLPADATPRDRVVFSSMGMAVQAVANEAILDVPHRRGGPFERGVLAGGIATAVFYATIGRSGSVSDIDQIATHGGISKTAASAGFVGVALLHSVRIARNGHYAEFFTAPAPEGVRVGVAILPAR